MYTKYGQIAAGMTHTFSDIWVEKLRTLEDSVPPQPLAVVEQTILEDTGVAAMSELFSSFDEVPLGSASIGQVHRATLTDGTEVAVKVQYPDSERLFRGDMKTIRQFITLAAPEQAVALDELERMFESEFDYTAEAKNLETVKANLSSAGFDKEIVVPAPRRELCTRRMLVMEYVIDPIPRLFLPLFPGTLQGQMHMFFATLCILLSC